MIFGETMSERLRKVDEEALQLRVNMINKTLLRLEGRVNIIERKQRKSNIAKDMRDSHDKLAAILDYLDLEVEKSNGYIARKKSKDEEAA